MVRRRRIRPASALESLSPIWISSNILILQIIFYSIAALLLLFTTLVQGSRFSPDLILSWQSLRADNTSGWTFALVWICNSLTNVFGITILVKRTKFVLDFGLTIHFIHLIVTTLYTHSLPTSWLWWAVQITSSVITVMLASWLCQRRELQPISWGGGSRNSRRGASTSGNPDTHEMVPLKDDQDIV